MDGYVYHQNTGVLTLNGLSVGKGYSGSPPFVNSPDAETMRSRGPIPRGDYRISGPFDHGRLGAAVFYLEPKPTNAMHGRSGFFIHGDNELGNQSASRGCIILARAIRDKIAASKVRHLTVK